MFRRLLPPLAACCAWLLTLAACGELKKAGPDGEDVDPDGATTSDDDDDDGKKDAGADGSPPADAEKKDAATPGEVCTEATCAPEVVQDGLYGPISVAVNATHVYWIEVGTKIPQGSGYGQLIRLPKDSACAERSCFEVLDYYALSGELEGQNIYGTRLALGLHDLCYTQSFNTPSSHAISCFDLVTTDKRSLEGGAGYVPDLWVGATEARWVIASSTTSSADGAVEGLALTGGTPTTLGPSRLRPTSVTSDGAKTYWTEFGASETGGSVQSTTTGDTITPLASARTQPVSAKVYGQHVYWIERSARRVMRAPSDGSGTPAQIATTDELPFDLVVDASGAYWLSAGTGKEGLYGSLAHAPLTPGGKVTTMLTKIDKVVSLAADLTSVYVASVGTDLDAGKIVRIAKTH